MNSLKTIREYHVPSGKVTLWWLGQLSFLFKSPGGRVVFRRRARIRSDHRRQVHDLTRRGLNLRRIHQPITAHPHTVARLRKIGYEVAPTIVGDNDLDKFGGQLGRFRDHPDPGFQPFVLATTPPMSLVSMPTGSTVGRKALIPASGTAKYRAKPTATTPAEFSILVVVISSLLWLFPEQHY